MQWIIKYLTSSIGKKQIMGCTGAVLALFILGHMVGNLQLLNPDVVAAQASYNAYTQLLTGKKAFIYAVEAVMSVTFLLHIYLAVKLKLENKKARGPVGYAVNVRNGKKSFATFTMIWSGIFVLGFVIQHLVTIKFGTHYYYQNEAGEIIRDMWLTTIDMFSNVGWAIFYLISLFVIGMHSFHAISSAFQTLGLAHQKWTPIIEKIGIAYSVVVALGFAIEAVAAFYFGNLDATKELREQSRKNSIELQKKVEAAKTSAYVLPASAEEIQVSYILEGGR
jgi:succinate dehydrogenase / fumarate reductase cytochrome b subunit